MSESVQTGMSNFDVSDDQLALELAEEWRGRFCYQADAKRWRELRNGAWVVDLYAHKQAAREFLREKARAVVASVDPDNRRECNRAANAVNQLRSSWKVRHMLALARTDPSLAYETVQTGTCEAKI